MLFTLRCSRYQVVPRLSSQAISFKEASWSLWLRSEMKSLTIDPKTEQAPTRDFPSDKTLPKHLPQPKEVNVHPSQAGGENASLFFVGTATTILSVLPEAKPMTWRSSN